MPLSTQDFWCFILFYLNLKAFCWLSIRCSLGGREINMARNQYQREKSIKAGHDIGSDELKINRHQCVCVCVFVYVIVPVYVFKFKTFKCSFAFQYKWIKLSSYLIKEIICADKIVHMYWWELFIKKGKDVIWFCYYCWYCFGLSFFVWLVLLVLLWDGGLLLYPRLT